MVGFLVKRPIATGMTFLAVLILGMVSMGFLPVSLVPDVDIPRISIRVSAGQYSAREVESTILAPLRMYLMQVNGLKELRSEARDGAGIISLEFEYGTSINLTYIEVNEQVDKATAALPPGVARPAVIKAAASDIPVFFLEVHYKEQPGRQNDVEEIRFQELSNFVNEIIRRRLEQIPQVAMADINGLAFPEIIVKPHTEKLHALGMQAEQIEQAIRANHINLGNILLRDKQYQYHIRMGNRLLDASDIANVYINHRGRLHQLGELCHIETRSREPEGLVFTGENRSLSLAIVKQADARMHDLKKELHQMVQYFRRDYPHLAFTITRDQTALLDYTLHNLRNTLILGAILSFVVMFLFLREGRAPWIIIISVPAGIVVSLLFFFLGGISLNIVSLSGLILCIGMMIDNSIIVIDNINRLRQEGIPLFPACVRGTEEVFRPLLSSVLTTCSVFIPLIFLGGLAGALFFDQAVAVSIGLLVSLAVAILIIPVLYFAMYKKKDAPTPSAESKWGYMHIYSRVFARVMKNQGVVFLLFLMGILLIWPLWRSISKERFPQMARTEITLHIDWNENIHIHENLRRNRWLLDSLSIRPAFSQVQAGRRQFMLEDLRNHNIQQSAVYIKTHTPHELDAITLQVAQLLQNHYPGALFHFEEEGNVFERVFNNRMAPLEVRLRPLADYGSDHTARIQTALQYLHTELPRWAYEPPAIQQSVVLHADTRLMALHEVSWAALQLALQRALNQNQVIEILDSRSVVPVKLGGDTEDLHRMLHTNRVINARGIGIPLYLLLKEGRMEELQTIHAGAEGAYYPVEMQVTTAELTGVMQQVRELLHKEGSFDASFAGSLFGQQQMMREMILIGSIALLLLFFILAAQFESLRLPFIVLLEVPLAISGALLMLWIFGASVNIMSLIGMVVMSGIIINDSILKIDTINRLRAEGMPLLQALHTAGTYRLKPILMTSITTITALLPFLFVQGMGGELQKPLALAVMGGLGLGTFVSLFFIPVCYYQLYKHQDHPQGPL